MKILVTGGAGFLGQATIRYGEALGHEMHSYDRIHGGDILSRHGLRTAVLNVDHVIHLAGVLGTAELFDDPHRAVEVNVGGALNVLQACEMAGAGYTAVTMPPVFPSVYTATKVCADRLATAWHHAHGLRVSHVVAYNAYGPGQKHGPGHPQKIIPTFATLAWQGRPLPVWGDGEQTVDLVHVDDIGRMLVDATAYGDDQTFHAGTGVALTVNQVADFVIEVVRDAGGEPTSRIEYLPMRKGEIPTHIVADDPHGWNRLGYQPQLDWDDLRAVIESYRPAVTG